MAVNDKIDSMFNSLRDHEEDFRTALSDYVWGYYRNYTDATELEPEVWRAMATLLAEGFVYTTMDVEEIVTRTENDINRMGGVVGSDGKRHKVSTFPDYEVEED